MKGRAACDSSILVPALISWHPEHRTSRAALRDDVDSVPAHVLVECFSVLTRLPAPHRISAGNAAEALASIGLKSITLPASRYSSIVSTLGRSGIAGGAVYDALVAETARHHDHLLLTRDRRARPTYDVMGVSYTLI
ncbi:hypothetical protein ASG90_19810 [Nocardioides sp. Soil797]|nr:hypothetical protein ASG90_19810 [Nocardioides sp. Soil797]